MKNPTVTLVTLLLVAMETYCFSAQRNQHRRSNWNNHNNDISVVNPLDASFSDESDESNEENNNQHDSYSSRVEIETEIPGNTEDDNDKIYRKNIFYPFPIVNEEQLDKISDKSKENEKDDSRKLPYVVNNYKRRTWDESSEEINIPSPRNQAKQRNVFKFNKGKVYNSDSGEVIRSPAFIGSSKVQDLQHINTNIHSPKRRSFANLRDVGRGYLEEEIFNTHLDADEIEPSENEDDENDEEQSDDEYNEDFSDDDNNAYEKYVDEIAKEYGYDSTEDDEDKGDESATK